MIVPKYRVARPYNRTADISSRIFCKTIRETFEFVPSEHGKISLLLKHLSKPLPFITNGYKRFSKANSTDPRQRVPLIHPQSNQCLNIQIQHC